MIFYFIVENIEVDVREGYMVFCCFGLGLGVVVVVFVIVM